MSDLKTYRGNCHCGAYVFEVQLPEIREGNQCNCSVCHRLGGVFQFPRNNDIKFVRGDPMTLSSYSFGDKKLKHQFCSNCGSYVFCVGSLTHPRGEDEAPQICVNLRMLQGVNVWDLDIQTMDGASLAPVYKPPEFKGPEPHAEIEGARIYTGSCHCGAVTLALKSKPIDSTYEGVIMECDCSICSRNGYCWVYPTKAQVTIDGVDNLTYYAFGRHIWKKTFCKMCGVPVHNHIDYFTKKQLAVMPKDDREWAAARLDMCPVNLRVLNGVDLSSLTIKKGDGSARFSTYVNP